MKKVEELMDHELDLKRTDPLTKQPFVANHRKRKHLSNKNKNEYHNQKRRLEKQKADLQTRVFIPDPPVTESRVLEIIQEQKVENEKAVSAQLLAAPVISPVHNTPMPMVNQPVTLAINNERKLLASMLGNQKECKGDKFKMLQVGFNFYAYDSQETLPGKDELLLNFGEYALIYCPNGETHITYRKYLLWAPNKLVINKNK